MYVTISPQKSGGNYAVSVADYVQYLEKENEGLTIGEHTFFFNQQESRVPWQQVVEAIDGNTAKLSRKEPRFYAITISPSQAELKALANPAADLKAYTRQLMEAYAKCFHRDIGGRPVAVSDILYFAKIEHKRYFKGTDSAVRQNQPVAGQIFELKTAIRRIQKDPPNADVSRFEDAITRLEAQAPQKLEGKRIREGMEKPGLQTHIHIIVSRKDASNSVSLSPGSKYKASKVVLAGKTVKRGFDRDRFFKQAEHVFDRQFKYQRNFVERYESRKLLGKHPDRFFKALLGLPASEKAIALRALAASGVRLPMLPANAPALALKIVKRVRHSVQRALSAGSIHI
jgi:hypothetical protein